MFLVERTTRTAGPDVVIEWPACGALSVPDASFDRQTRSLYLGLIPVPSARRTFVVCAVRGEPRGVGRSDRTRRDDAG